MLGLDTNVLVRFLVRDHEAQFERARRLIKREFGARKRSSSACWSCSKPSGSCEADTACTRRQIVGDIFGALDAAELELEDEPSIEEALYLWKDSASEFADCLIGARHRRLGCRATATFDAKAVKLPGFVTA